MFRFSAYTTIATTNNNRTLSTLKNTISISKREVLKCDVLVVGGGPSGLATSIRLKKRDPNLNVIILEKGSEIGSHILSGAVIEMISLKELFSKEKLSPSPSPSSIDPFPLTSTVKEDYFHYLLNSSKYIAIPTFGLQNNSSNLIGSLSQMCKWMSRRAEEIGVQVFPGFSASSLIYNDQGDGIIGCRTGDIGDPASNDDDYQEGMDIIATTTVLAEGCHGHLSKEAINHFKLRDSSHQTYALGIKEVWQVQDLHNSDSEVKFKEGTVIHTIGYPLSCYGGGFLYKWKDLEGRMLISIGLVIGLDYKDTSMKLYEEFQLLKAHPSIEAHLKGSIPIEYGARALTEGGIQGIPERLSFKGGYIVGCGAGFMNVLKIKGTHTAIKSGIICADSIIDGSSYEEGLRSSWLWKELWAVRNVRPSFSKFSSKIGAMAYLFFEQCIMRSKVPWTFKLSNLKKDHESMSPLRVEKHYPPPNNVTTFPLLTSLQRSGVKHRSGQRKHLLIEGDMEYKNDGIEERFCPAGVYEYIKDVRGKKMLHINAENCIHCKTCDIKDPSQRITWTTPEGGGGPQYNMT